MYRERYRYRYSRRVFHISPHIHVYVAAHTHTQTDILFSDTGALDKKDVHWSREHLRCLFVATYFRKRELVAAQFLIKTSSDA